MASAGSHGRSRLRPATRSGGLRQPGGGESEGFGGQFLALAAIGDGGGGDEIPEGARLAFSQAFHEIAAGKAGVDALVDTFVEEDFLFRGGHDSVDLIHVRDGGDERAPCGEIFEKSDGVQEFFGFLRGRELFVFQKRSHVVFVLPERGAEAVEGGHIAQGGAVVRLESLQNFRHGADSAIEVHAFVLCDVPVDFLSENRGGNSFGDLIEGIGIGCGSDGAEGGSEQADLGGSLTAIQFLKEFFRVDLTHEVQEIRGGAGDGGGAAEKRLAQHGRYAVLTLFQEAGFPKAGHLFLGIESGDGGDELADFRVGFVQLLEVGGG